MHTSQNMHHKIPKDFATLHTSQNISRHSLAPTQDRIIKVLLPLADLVEEYESCYPKAYPSVVVVLGTSWGTTLESWGTC